MKKTFLHNDLSIFGMLPKIKVHDINTDIYKDENKDSFIEAIKAKSPELSVLLDDTNNKCEALFISEQEKACVLKVSPVIRDAIIKKGKLYVDMQSHKVSDHFHVQQCYKCQGFGHKSGSDKCPLKEGGNHCLYCGGNHMSKSCPCKKDTSQHKCINCLNSSNPKIKSNAHGHTASSKQCPLYRKEVENIISRTNFTHVA